MLLQILIYTVILLVLFKFVDHLRYSSRKRQYGCQDPPSYPHKDPILGLDFFFKSMNSLKSGNYLDSRLELFQPFQSKTFRSSSFGTTTFHTIDPEVVKNYQTLHFDEFDYAPLRYHLAENLWGNGIAVSDGTEWSAARSFISSSFDYVHTANIERLEYHVGKFMKLLPCDGSTVDLLPLFKRLILDTSSEFIFGQSLNALDHPDPSFVHAFQYAQRGTGIRMLLGRLKFLHRDQKWFDACKQVTDFCESHVNEAISRMEKGQERRTEKDRLRMVDEAAKATRDRYTLRSLVLSVFSPAHDGAAVALSNIFHLARHPRRICLKDTVFPCGGGPDGTMPLYLRKGDLIEADYRTMMRDPEFWGPDANEFLPERWQKVRPTWEYTPFGGGPRACVGMRLVFTECAYTIVTIMRDFKALENRDVELEWKEQARMTWESKNGTVVGLIPA
ncbi:cytochrome P450 [Lophiostoma macrostomum CBS 122681]|uniref:Cytochrome P450 n=1 Tax=Lophiostoma macrostomum CBS 122681 TaxID=1314788 RepID=A0A6A6TSP1_9PLEO|nr:cytochrome P450 [Lophiostoma macrostomum CBS 122681]